MLHDRWNPAQFIKLMNGMACQPSREDDEHDAGQLEEAAQIQFDGRIEHQPTDDHGGDQTEQAAQRLEQAWTLGRLAAVDFTGQLKQDGHGVGCAKVFVHGRFETGGHRAIYADGWRATVYHTYGTPFSTDRWELFDTRTDFNEQNNLAEKYPRQLKKMVRLFEQQAKKYKVYPMQESWFPADAYLQISDSRMKGR